ncbi:MAG: DUF1330 domain-containing protein [Chloroflexota bacterium]
MTAYIMARINVTDMDQYKKYIALTPAIIEKFGGKFISRGGETVTLEGEPESRRMVLLEFPSVEAAQEFYNSDEYQAAIEVRKDAAEGQFMILPGV